MHDPFPLPAPTWLVRAVTPLADALNLPTLPLHSHEILFAFALYQFTQTAVSPALSKRLFPQTYANLSPRSRLNWDVHVVSLLQSVLVCATALWVMSVDGERKDMGWEARVWGYTGGTGLVQALATGYFAWDLVVTARNVRVFGPGMLAHAVAALTVFSFGFRPFVNYYGPTFILYELSSPFLNVHWFCDKLNMTGSTLQFLNGLCLLATFAGCRLVWGSYNSVLVYYDAWRAFAASSSSGPAFSLKALSAADAEALRFYGTGDADVPLWLVAAYLGSNLTLNGLNWYWFGKMIETLRKRFDPPFGTR
ncbi:DUF887-domain-containing protein, partial [Trichodelitschia bisporula]